MSLILTGCPIQNLTSNNPIKIDMSQNQPTSPNLEENPKFVNKQGKISLIASNRTSVVNHYY